MCRKATFTLSCSLRDENGDRWPEAVGEEGDGPHREKLLLERVTAAAERGVTDGV